jgi:hypothetical protein
MFACFTIGSETKSVPCAVAPKTQRGSDVLLNLKYNTMERYQNFGGDSGVSAYEIGSDYIRVRFSTGAVYSYSYRKAGGAHVERMKALARNGSGLNSYINRYAKFLYD